LPWYIGANGELAWDEPPKPKPKPGWPQEPWAQFFGPATGYAAPEVPRISQPTALERLLQRFGPATGYTAPPAPAPAQPTALERWMGTGGAAAQQPAGGPQVQQYGAGAYDVGGGRGEAGIWTLYGMTRAQWDEAQAAYAQSINPNYVAPPYRVPGAGEGPAGFQVWNPATGRVEERRTPADIGQAVADDAAQRAAAASGAPAGISQAWWSAFQAQHGGQSPTDFYGGDLEQAQRDAQWGARFLVEHGRPPTQADWEASYYARQPGGSQYGGGGPTIGAGGGGGGGGLGPAEAEMLAAFGGADYLKALMRSPNEIYSTWLSRVGAGMDPWTGPLQNYMTKLGKYPDAMSRAWLLDYLGWGGVVDPTTMAAVEGMPTSPFYTKLMAGQRATRFTTSPYGGLTALAPTEGQRALEQGAAMPAGAGGAYAGRWRPPKIKSPYPATWSR